MNNLFVSYILLFSIILILFFIANTILLKPNDKEHFLNIYQILNDSFKTKIKENDKNVSIHRKFNNFHELFHGFIKLTYINKNNIYTFYSFNYENKIFMKTIIDKKSNLFNIYDMSEDTLNKNNNKEQKIGSLVNKHHNQYILDLKKIYKFNHYFYISDNFKTIKIYNQFEHEFYQVKKTDDNYLLKIYSYHDEIGKINIDESKKSFKISCSKKHFKKISLFSYSLMIFICNNQLN